MAVSEIYQLVDQTLQRARDLAGTDLDAAVRMQEELLTRTESHPRARMAVLLQVVVHKERLERIQRGEPPHHASRMNHLLFRHARAFLVDLEKASETTLASAPTDNDARACLALARFCLGDLVSAETLSRSMPSTAGGGLWSAIRFTPAFYDELRGLSDDDLERGLPAVTALTTMPGRSDGIVYLSCNYPYFAAFALPMILSLRDRSPKTSVHLHIMDVPPERTKFLLDMAQALRPLACAMTIEQPGFTIANSIEARCYYHAIRFIRFYKHLKTYQSPLWLMDVDALVNRDLSSLWERLPGHDIALRIRPGRLEPWHQFNACVVGANNTPRSLDYFRLVAAYIAYFHQRGALCWGIDQLAMHGVFTDELARGSAPSPRLLGEREVDYDQGGDGYIWPNSGKRKMMHFMRAQRPGTPPSAAPANKFDEVFEKYWQEAVQIAGAAGVKF